MCIMYNTLNCVLLMQELEEAQKTIEELQTSKAQLEEKGTKMGKMVKAAKARIQALTAEKQQV